MASRLEADLIHNPVKEGSIESFGHRIPSSYSLNRKKSRTKRGSKGRRGGWKEMVREGEMGEERIREKEGGDRRGGGAKRRNGVVWRRGGDGRGGEEERRRWGR